VILCDHFIDKQSRPHDNRVRASKSGVQKIPESSIASEISKKFELEFAVVRRTGLEEFLVDYKVFLRQWGLSIWDRDSLEYLEVRKKSESDLSDLSNLFSSETFAFIVICLINQAIYIFRPQIYPLKKQFLWSFYRINGACLKTGNNRN